DFKMTDKPFTPAATCRRARAQALRWGLKHVYTGNIVDRDGQVTRCPGCGAPAIRRDGYRILDYAVDAAGRCRCGRKLAGRFEGKAGTWGAHRLRVSVAE